MDNLIYLVIIFLAIVGFSIAYHICCKKRAKKAMVCPLNFKCDAVIYSRYSRFLGAPIEILGMIYYGLIAASYFLFLFLPKIKTPELFFFILALTLVSFSFSVYLIFVQAFRLKEWCSWCLGSALISGLIFVLAYSSESNLKNFMLLAERYGSLMVGIHLLAASLGIGVVTASDILFFRFLRDLRISHEEADVLHTLSQIIWFALGLIIVTGIIIYAPNQDLLMASSKFLAKIGITIVLILNGVFLNIFVAPKLVEISFGEEHEHMSGELHILRKMAFASGAISITSWYSVFTLGLIKTTTFTFVEVFSIYLIVLLIAVTTSQILERNLKMLKE